MAGGSPVRYNIDTPILIATPQPIKFHMPSYCSNIFMMSDTVMHYNVLSHKIAAMSAALRTIIQLTVVLAGAGADVL